jgi:DinB superfamily
MALDPRVEILKTLRATPVILRTLVRDVGNEDAQRKPSPGEWAVIEVIAHMADTDERAAGRVKQIVAEDDPELSAFDQVLLAIDSRYLGRDLMAELDRYEMGRRDHGNGSREWPPTINGTELSVRSRIEPVRQGPGFGSES